MPPSHSPGRAARKTQPPPPLAVLAVLPQENVAPELQQALGDGHWRHEARVYQADSLVQARARLAAARVDLVVLDIEPEDAASLRLLEELSRQPIRPRIIVTSQRPSLDLALAVMRLGVSDLIALPQAGAELPQRLQRAVTQLRQEQDQRRREQRLRRLCHKLQHARQEITQKVDELCGDLVHAYQELAQQMQQTIQSSEFNAVVRGELDLEQFVRKLLEFILEKTGPTNAAIYLPAPGAAAGMAGAEEFALGGYVNYDLSSSAPDVLLQDIADHLAPQLAGGAAALLACENGPELTHHLGGKVIAGLAQSQTLAIACRHEGQTLAVLTVFRHQAQPFNEDMRATVAAVAPLIGQGLARIIRVHHRSLPFSDKH